MEVYTDYVRSTALVKRDIFILYLILYKICSLVLSYNPGPKILRTATIQYTVTHSNKKSFNIRRWGGYVNTKSILQFQILVHTISVMYIQFSLKLRCGCGCFSFHSTFVYFFLLHFFSLFFCQNTIFNSIHKEVLFDKTMQDGQIELNRKKKFLN